MVNKHLALWLRVLTLDADGSGGPVLALEAGSALLFLGGASLRNCRQRWRISITPCNLTAVNGQFSPREDTPGGSTLNPITDGSLGSLFGKFWSLSYPERLSKSREINLLSVL